MTCRGLLFAELERAVANCQRLFRLAGTEHYAWKPREGMRSFSELANHLAQVPSVDLLILRSAPEAEIVALEAELVRSDAEGWCAVIQDGCQQLQRLMEKLSYDNFENDSGTAYYGRTQTYAQWLLEAITHIYHHRAQLFTYLKLLGYPVSTRTLYE